MNKRVSQLLGWAYLNSYMYKPYTLSLLLLISFFSKAQGLINFNSKAIEQDFVYNLNLYGEQYTAPVLAAFSFSQINAWQYSAELLAPGAFRIGLISSAAFAPNDRLTFNFNQVAFSDKLELKDPSDPILVTALGGPTDKILEYTVNSSDGSMRYTQEIPAFAGFSSPNNIIPNAVPQISIGLPKGFEVSARFLPFLKIGDVSHSELGIGLKHDVAQYFKADKNLSFSVGGFYDVNQFNYKPVDFLKGENQNIQLISHAFLVETAASYRFGILDVLAGLGVYTMNNSFQIQGTYRYKVERNGPLGPAVVQEAFSTTDPIRINKKVNGLRFTTGINLNLGSVIDFGLAYHAAAVNTISASLGITLLNNKSER